MINVALDLEFTQPSEKILQIGITIGESNTRTIIESRSWYVNPEEPLSDYIKTLCHVKDESLIHNAPDLLTVYKDIASYLNDWSYHKQLIVWGSGDGWQLRSQLYQANPHVEWIFGRTEMNVKNLVQAHQVALGQKSQGGLAKMMGKYNLSFKGTKHDAGDDSRNTLVLYYKMLDMMKNM